MTSRLHSASSIAAAGCVVLVLSSCAAGDTEGPENADLSATTETTPAEAEADGAEESWDPADPENHLTVECTDPDALAENKDHEPAGWPQEWEEGDPMPDPECHPDFIEVEKWDQYDDFVACWDGPLTSTTVREPDMTDQDAYRVLWVHSELRADWEIPRGEHAPFETAEEGRAAMASEDCIALYEDVAAS